jgi:hypothetical protein
VPPCDTFRLSQFQLTVENRRWRSKPLNERYGDFHNTRERFVIPKTVSNHCGSAVGLISCRA